MKVDVESGISHATPHRRDPAKLWGVPLRMSDKDLVYFLVSGAILSYLGASPAVRRIASNRGTRTFFFVPSLSVHRIGRSIADLAFPSSAGFTATQEGVFRGADFHYGGMVTLFTTLVYCAAAALERQKSNDAVRKGSWGNYLVLAAITTGSMWITNAAMQYLNYTTRIVAKSSKVIPTMILGTFMQGRTYGRVEYACATLLVCGIALFTMGGETTSHTLPCE